MVMRFVLSEIEVLEDVFPGFLNRFKKDGFNLMFNALKIDVTLFPSVIKYHTACFMAHALRYDAPSN
jgi:hypothetical protein